MISELHRRASLWYEQHDLPMEAVQYALAARDVEHAARLIEKCAMVVIGLGKTRMLLEWLNALPLPPGRRWMPDEDAHAP